MRDLLDLWEGWTLGFLEIFVEFLKVLATMFVVLFGLAYSTLILLFVLAILLLPIIGVILLARFL